MTIYLWNNFAIWLVPIALQRLGLGEYDTPDLRGHVLEYGAVWLLIGAAILLVGWVEDVAAGRRARLLPWTRVPRPRRTTVRADREVVFEGNEVRLERGTVPEGLPGRRAADDVMSKGSVPEAEGMVQFRDNRVWSADAGSSVHEADQPA
jgi:hypothetical protein